MRGLFFLWILVVVTLNTSVSHFVLPSSSAMHRVRSDSLPSVPVSSGDSIAVVTKHTSSTAIGDDQAFPATGVFQRMFCLSDQTKGTENRTVCMALIGATEFCPVFSGGKRAGNEKS